MHSKGITVLSHQDNATLRVDGDHAHGQVAEMHHAVDPGRIPSGRSTWSSRTSYPGIRVDGPAGKAGPGPGALRSRRVREILAMGGNILLRRSARPGPDGPRPRERSSARRPMDAERVQARLRPGAPGPGPARNTAVPPTQASHASTDCRRCNRWARPSPWRIISEFRHDLAVPEVNTEHRESPRLEKSRSPPARRRS